MDDRFRAHASLNGGYLLRPQILDLGGSDREIRRAVAEGVLVRIRTGTYAFGDVHRLLNPEEKHLVLARSVLDRLNPGTVALSHASACCHHGLDLFDVDLARVHITRLDGGAGRAEAGVVHHVGRVGEEEVIERNGILVTAPKRAVWEAACNTSQRGALVVMDSALHRRLLAPEELRDAAARYVSWQGARAANLVRRAADSGAETPGESLMRFLCIEQMLPPPTTQHEVFDEAGVLVARTDLAWEFYRHLGEFDGLRKYSRDLRPGDDPSDVVVREKLREDRARRLSWGMSRVTWAEVLPRSARATGLMLRRDLEQSRSLYTRNRVIIA